MKSIWNHNLIQASRVAKGLQAKDAAKALNITPEYLSMVENGHSQPSQKLIIAMMQLYDCEISAFLNDHKPTSV